MRASRAFFTILLISDFALPAAAQVPQYYLTGPLGVRTTMTKVAEGALDFSYMVSPLMSNGLDPYVHLGSQSDPPHRQYWLPLPAATCADTTCGPGYSCYDSPTGPVCYPNITCADISCAQGYHCVDTPTGATCVCSCPPGFHCETVDLVNTICVSNSVSVVPSTWGLLKARYRSPH
jgi:hypothetical protein